MTLTSVTLTPIETPAEKARSSAEERTRYRSADPSPVLCTIAANRSACVYEIDAFAPDSISTVGIESVSKPFFTDF